MAKTERTCILVKSEASFKFHSFSSHFLGVKENIFTMEIIMLICLMFLRAKQTSVKYILMNVMRISLSFLVCVVICIVITAKRLHPKMIYKINLSSPGIHLHRALC